MAQETKIQNEIIKYLNQQGIFCWRNNNGSIYDVNLKQYRSFTGMKGVPDIICVIDGQFVGIEVKTKTGKQSPDQLLFQKRLERNGGRYYIVRCLEDVKQALAENKE